MPLTIFAENFIRYVRLGSKYTSDIQTFEKKTHQKFVSCQNSFHSRGSHSFCNIYKPLLKVTYLAHFYFFDL